MEFEVGAAAYLPNPAVDRPLMSDLRHTPIDSEF